LGFDNLIFEIEVDHINSPTLNSTQYEIVIQ